MQFAPKSTDRTRRSFIIATMTARVLFLDIDWEIRSIKHILWHPVANHGARYRKVHDPYGHLIVIMREEFLAHGKSHLTYVATKTTPAIPIPSFESAYVGSGESLRSLAPWTPFRDIRLPRDEPDLAYRHLHEFDRCFAHHAQDMPLTRSGRFLNRWERGSPMTI